MVAVAEVPTDADIEVDNSTPVFDFFVAKRGDPFLVSASARRITHSRVDERLDPADHPLPGKGRPTPKRPPVKRKRNA